MRLEPILTALALLNLAVLAGEALYQVARALLGL
jgi:hypothetical protein